MDGAKPTLSTRHDEPITIEFRDAACVFCGAELTISATCAQNCEASRRSDALNRAMRHG